MSERVPESCAGGAMGSIAIYHTPCLPVTGVNL
jgi:hypothetical protein